jgi:hypothetical protein
MIQVTTKARLQVEQRHGMSQYLNSVESLLVEAAAQ